ncbi:RNA polymerase sigma factor sigF, chloroplastic [Magnolia sinica]|uniref:RNA polymerase sigma factor sigF, chloroplastic n=1 Tax=Magnolia sinica TaxID=86752 RepID=UPI00265AE39D|nr:RNA polymerase sigma factor sigF, chloroplastic [Magnolia sinica]XP_058082132.1 RNA polymerase sigma factor sigF, chloroplastic [Magnolia sinica]XP_058082133.1 RNA polymerase sigma factor sigF, chloroplastic [Magnolia sinica]XP_058082134.1 RNA polymerase sigma factor sigF, chloroplastic [Magnolia sinica]
MEAGRRMISSPSIHPPKTHLTVSLSSSVPMIHEQAAPAVTSMPTTSIAHHFPASVLLQEQRDDFRPLHIGREDKTSLATLDRRRIESGVAFFEEKRSYQYDQYIKDFERQLLYWPGFWYLLPSSLREERSLLPLLMEPIATDTDNVLDIKPMGVAQNSPNSMRPWDVLALAKKAAMASKEAASLAKDCNFLSADLDESLISGLGPGEFGVEVIVEEQPTVKSRRLVERKLKKRRVPKKPKVVTHAVSSSKAIEKGKKINYEFDPNDPLRLFLWGPETKQLLTGKEESDLFVQIQELMKLEEVKQRLQSQFDREPTLVEWAEAIGMSCRDLQSCLYSGNRSREKMIYANFRLVVHVAKQYQGRGLILQDLLQEGSMGLMKSLEKFKPQAGCRFSTYAYWWIRQSIRKAIVQNSRTIRLPENVYGLLTKIRNARKSYIQEGHRPTNEELAKCVGITVEKFEMLRLSTRIPVSIQQPAWIDQDVTFQEITADPRVEPPDLSITKQLMRRHMRNLLSILTPRERQIIQFRYGIHDGERKSLSNIGALYGLSKERVRQVESRALDKLKQCLSSQGLEAYVSLLI